jgi:23S rRNA (cytosine1962-C5)-methyltransferase
MSGAMRYLAGDNAQGGPMKTIQLKKPLEDAVRRGHPWVFRDALKLREGLRAGQVVDLLDRQGGFLARGTVEPGSALAFRAWTLDRKEAVDAALVHRRLERAAALRAEILDPRVTGYRLCHGENDDLPGLQCDIYDGIASLRTDNRLGLAWEEAYLDAIRAVANPRAIVVRNPRRNDGEPVVIEGQVPREVIIEEVGRKFVVHILEGQKTGFFLDQRDNRDRVAALSPGRSVLNCFSYTGGFSVAAALAGASRVVTVDIAKPAIEAAKRNFDINQIPRKGHGFLAADAFDVLADASKRPGEFDLIVLDPPSFAPSRKAVPKALRAYERLNEFAMRALPPGGWLISASCSSHIGEKALMECIAEGARKAGRHTTVAGVFGPGPDHPRRLGFPEGHYLKFFMLRVH